MGGDVVEVEGNADLIAAAPEMYEALETLIRLSAEGPEAFDGEPLEAIVAGQEALAKARGQE